MLQDLIGEEFQSTLPVGGATATVAVSSVGTQHFNPRSPWGERPDCSAGISGSPPISIHAPRGGSDHPPHRCRTFAGYFNPRSPWGERQRTVPDMIAMTEFQSTLPVGGATFFGLLSANSINYFNPRSPWGERPPFSFAYLNVLDFNPRSPWGERPYVKDAEDKTIEFQSTLPVGGATAKMHNFPAASLAKVSKFVWHDPGKAMPNRFDSRNSLHRITKKPCEPAGKTCALAHRNQIISVSSGWYVFLQPKCSTFFSYWFPR